MSQKKNWRQKLAAGKGLPRIEPIPAGMQRTCGEGTLVIPAPKEVDAAMRRVPKGKVTTIDHIRRMLAEQHGASTGCPITTGIFARIAAGAAAEDIAEGRRRVTPYWRTLKSEGEVNPKYPGGVEDQKARLEAEGHRVVSRGKRFFVVDYESRLAKL
jgi:alkylated DNA nucleotide flippase Atl1